MVEGNRGGVSWQQSRAGGGAWPRAGRWSRGGEAGPRELRGGAAETQLLILNAVGAWPCGGVVRGRWAGPSGETGLGEAGDRQALCTTPLL